MEKETVSQLIQRVHTLMSEMNNKQIDREELIQLLVISLFSLKHTFLLGEPGVSKTGILEIFATTIQSDNKFSITIKHDTMYEEIFGDRFRDEGGKLEYDSTGSIVEADFAILDETWKGNSKVMNSLLSIMSNYRNIEIMGKGQVKVPLLMVGGASNELPLDKEVRPLRDRFLFSYVVEKITGEENWVKFASRQYDRNPVLDTKFSPEEIRYLNELSRTVKIPDYIYQTLFKIRQRVVTLAIGVSERKFDGAIDVFLISAFLNERDEVNFSELFFLVHILWEKESDLPLINKILNDEIFGQLDAVLNYIDEIELAKNRLNSAVNGRMSDFIKHRKEYSFGETQIFEQQYNMVVNLTNDFSNLLKQIKMVKDHYDMNMQVEQELCENHFIRNRVSPIYAQLNFSNVTKIIDEISKRTEELNEWLLNNAEMYSYNMQVNK